MMAYTRFDGWRFVWNGSKTVNVHRPDGRNVDVFSLDYGRDDHKLENVLDLCDEWGMSWA